MDIEEAFTISGLDTSLTKGGGRHLLSGKHGVKTIAFYNTLLERTSLGSELDPNGTIIHKQSPCGVGFSKELSGRMECHLSDNDLSSTNKPWQLIRSCLEVMGIEVKPVVIPVLKLWSEDQRALGEIMITLLCGSLIEDGGFNPTQAGSLRKESTRSHNKEEAEVFSDNTFFVDNSKNEEAELQRRMETLSTVKAWSGGGTDAILAVGRSTLAELSQSIEKRSDLLNGEVEKLREHIERQNEDERQLLSQQAKKDEISSLMDEIDAWTNG